MKNLNTDFILAVSYAVIQATITILMSILGAIHVHRCSKKDTLNQSFCKLWFRSVWKMRSVYGSLAVHAFDVITDILVVKEWASTPDEEVDNIDPQVMAICGISVILMSRIVSAVAIFVKEYSITRSILQLFDLLIFQEIYEAHRKIVSNWNNKQTEDNTAAVDSTITFKYVRSMEAILESIPQSVLQLVFVTRTSDVKAIFVLSILQSIVSMTNSILNEDYTRMLQTKWKMHKKRFPPTCQFIQHAISRLSEVAYRIGLLALIWTVCEGVAFSFMLAIELIFICLRILFLMKKYDLQLTTDVVLLNFNTLVVVPSEDVYNHKDAGKICTDYCCCIGLCAVVMQIKGVITGDAQYPGLVPLTRMTLSFFEFVVLVMWAIVADNGNRAQFLFDFNYGLGIFIATLVFYLIYTQYMWLAPDFSLPYGVKVRSKFGYAYSNEFTELMKVKIPFNKMPYVVKVNRSSYKIWDVVDFWDEPHQMVKESNLYRCSKCKEQFDISDKNNVMTVYEANKCTVQNCTGSVYPKPWLDPPLLNYQTQLKKVSKNYNRDEATCSICRDKNYASYVCIDNYSERAKQQKMMKLKCPKSKTGELYPNYYIQPDSVNNLEGMCLECGKFYDNKSYAKIKKDAKLSCSVLGCDGKLDIFYLHLTAAVFAAARGNDEIVEWLETQKANYHKTIDLQSAVRHIEI
eukprot:275165_1